MSRPEGKFDHCTEERVDAAEILAALARERSGSTEERRDAVSRYLSAVDGWREASAHLGGAFAAKEDGLHGNGEE